MPLKLTCPHCGHPARLTEPFPLPGARLHCEGCGQGLVVSYPDGVMDALKARGKIFQSEEAAGPRTPHTPKAKAPPPPPPTAAPATHKAARKAAPRPTETPSPTEVPTTVDPTMVESPNPDAYFDRTVPSARTPYGGLPNNANEPEATHASLGEEDEPTESHEDPIPVVQAPKRAARELKASEDTKTEVAWKKRNVVRAGASAPPTGPKAKRRGGCFRGGLLAAAVLLLGAVLVGGAVAGGAYWHYSSQLPTIETLKAYRPPTVTEVYDHKGRLLGEIYEQRRYVVPLEKIPKHVQNAFVAAEDADFWHHGGVDYVGLTRAVLHEIFTRGSKSQGASTITM